MVFWLHCNKCYKQFQKTANTTFFLASCGHLACEECANLIRKSNNTCVICKKNADLLKLSNDMDPSIQPFFMPLEKDLQKCVQVYNFQNNHIQSLVSAFRKKYEIVKQEYMKSCNTIKKLEEENKMLKSLLKKPGNNGNFSRPTSTPTLNCFQNSTLQNTSKSTISPINGFSSFIRFNKNESSSSRPPGIAQRLSTSRMSINSNNSSLNSTISPNQVVPHENVRRGFAAIHGNRKPKWMLFSDSPMNRNSRK